MGLELGSGLEKSYCGNLESGLFLTLGKGNARNENLKTTFIDQIYPQLTTEKWFSQPQVIIKSIFLGTLFRQFMVRDPSCALILIKYINLYVSTS